MQLRRKMLIVAQTIRFDSARAARPAKASLDRATCEHLGKNVCIFVDLEIFTESRKSDFLLFWNKGTVDKKQCVKSYGAWVNVLPEKKLYDLDRKSSAEVVNGVIVISHS